MPIAKVCERVNPIHWLLPIKCVQLVREVIKAYINA